MTAIPLIAKNPLEVTTTDPATGARRVTLWIGDHADPALPTGLALRGAMCPGRSVVRLGGGCKGLDDGMKAELRDYCLAAFAGFSGTMFSGATRDIRDGQIDLMITDIAVAIHHANPGSILLGTFPRTAGTFGLVGDSEFVVGEYDTRPNPEYNGIYIVQNGLEGVQGWDGDLDKAFSLMKSWRADAALSVGCVDVNGGDVTKQEIRRSAAAGYPTILVNGFGRETDAHVAELRSGADWIPRRHNIMIAERDDPQSLRHALIEGGLLAA